MGWNANSAMRLLASDKPFAAVVGRKRVDKPNSEPEVWCGAPLASGPSRSFTTDAMGFAPFERVGMAFVKIAREVFEAIIKANPEWKRAGHSGMPDEVKAQYYRFFRFGDDVYETGEDFEFCNAWRAMGGEIWVDIDQPLTHVGEKAYSGVFGEQLKIAAPDIQEAAESSITGQSAITYGKVGATASRATSAPPRWRVRSRRRLAGRTMSAVRLAIIPTRTRAVTLGRVKDSLPADDRQRRPW